MPDVLSVTITRTGGVAGLTRTATIQITANVPEYPAKAEAHAVSTGHPDQFTYHFAFATANNKTEFTVRESELTSDLAELVKDAFGG